MGNGWHEWPLVIFTVLGQCVVGALIVSGIGWFAAKNDADRQHIVRGMFFLWLLMGIGFIASVMHLGSPLRAFNSLNRIGDSGLSNEIAAGSIFFAVGGLWWLVTIIVTVVVGLIGYLFGRSVFKALDENRADIKEVRESYTTQKDHKDDLDDIRREIKEVRSEMKTEIQALSEDIKEVKEKCLRKSDFERSVLQLESKVDALTRYLMERRV